jgi:hypothetical protein
MKLKKAIVRELQGLLDESNLFTFYTILSFIFIDTNIGSGSVL